MPIHNVADAMHEIGKSKHIKNRAQAVAVGLSEERREGKHVPPPPRGSRKSAQKAAFGAAKKRVGSKE